MAGSRASGTRALPRWSIVLVAIAVSAPAWVVGTRGAALALAATAPERAIAWNPDDPEALVRINEREADPARKADRVRRILAQQPIDGRAYRQLAEVADAAGDRSRAAALYSIAARHSPRDRLSRAWLADHAFEQGAYGVALAHIDALLRMDASLREPLFERLALLSANATFRAALVALLQRGPEWRAQFLSWREDRLLAQHRWEEARRVRAETASLTGSGTAGGIVNGGFEQDPEGGFDWRLGDGARQRTAIASEADGNRALRVELFGPGVRLGGIAQLLVLGPGRYVVGLRARMDGLRAEGGLVAAMSCAGDNATPLSRSQPLRGSSPWRNLSFEVVVPADCPAQWLRLELASPVLDRNATGVAWFDDFSVRPLDGAVAARATAGAPPPAPAPSAAAAPAHAGFHEAVARTLASLPDRDDRDAPFGP